MSRASDALVSLSVFLADLLCEQLKNYPITAGLMARGSFIKRGLEEEYHTVLAGLMRPSDPWRTFENWRFEVERQKTGNPVEGKRNRAYLAICLHKSGKEIWLLVDEKNRLALRLPEQKINTNQQRSLDSIRGSVQDHRSETDYLIGIIGTNPIFDKKVQAEWIPLYKVSSLRCISRSPISYLID